MTAWRWPFHLSNQEKLTEDLKAAGFWSVKSFYTCMNPGIYTIEQYKALQFGLGLDAIYNQLPED